MICQQQRQTTGDSDRDREPLCRRPTTIINNCIYKYLHPTPPFPRLLARVCTTILRSYYRSSTSWCDLVSRSIGSTQKIGFGIGSEKYNGEN